MKVELHGNIPVKIKVYDGKETNTELTKIEFCIKDTIPRLDRMGKRNPYGANHQITKKEYLGLK